MYDFVREHLDYREGQLFWKKPTSFSVKPGQRAGCQSSTCSYRTVRLKGILYLEHRVIWLWHNGAFPKYELDHIDRNRQNNKIENLREVNRQENMLNKTDYRNNTSGVRNITKRSNGKYVFCKRRNNKMVVYKEFNTMEEALEYGHKWSELKSP